MIIKNIFINTILKRNITWLNIMGKPNYTCEIAMKIIDVVNQLDLIIFEDKTRDSILDMFDKTKKYHPLLAKQIYSIFKKE